MRCYVTGASGFIGADFERVNGEVSDPKKLVASMRGCDWCFHVAASYRLWLRDYAPMYAANVEGTRNVIEAAAEAGCSRIVYTSTVGCIGLPRAVRDSGRGSADQRFAPTDETTPVSEAQMSNHYKLSKWKAEFVA